MASAGREGPPQLRRHCPEQGGRSAGYSRPRPRIDDDHCLAGPMHAEVVEEEPP